MLCVTLAFGAPVAAQDGTPPDGGSGSDNPPADTTGDPNAGSDQPTDVPVVEPTDVPTDEPVIEPTEEPTLEPTLEPTPEPTLEPTVEPTATESPSPTPSPTATPAPKLTYTLVAQPECALAPDQTSEIASGGTQDYLCTDTVALMGTGIIPADLSMQWNIQTSIDGGGGVQVLPPANPGETAEWTAPNASSAQFSFAPLLPLGDGTDPATVDSTVKITFGLRLSRPACGLESIPLVMTHDVAINAAETVAESATTGQPDPLKLNPDLQPVPDPVVAFGGSLDFGEVNLTATGPDQPVKQGTLTVNISDLNETCGDWTLHLSSTTLTDGAGHPLDGSKLVVTSIDGVVLPDGGCDLASGCDLLTLTGGADAPMTTTHELGVELRMSEQPGTGTFHTSLSAALNPLVGN